MSSIAAGIATVPHNVIKGIRASNKRGKSPSPGPSSNAQEPPNGPSSSQIQASQQLQGTPGDNNQVEQQESSNSHAAEVAKNAAIQVGEGIGGIVGAAVKSPMNFSVGLAKGLKYAPRLYHDELIRQPDKIDSFSSGLKVAGKELALGFYDGVAGLAVQPWKGAVKEGPKGFIKGFGKGVGGLIFKPAAGKIPSLVLFFFFWLTLSSQASLVSRLTRCRVFTLTSGPCSRAMCQTISLHRASNRARTTSKLRQTMSETLC